ncbi:MAG: hypothetical protein ACTSR9_14790 [Candidatus Thorarchaeota archaeon]
MVETVAEYCDRVERTIDPSEVINNIYLSEFSLNWLLLQHGLFKQVVHDCPSSRWTALQHYLEHGKQLLSIDSPVLGSFFNSYGATGRFLLDKRIGRTSSHNYFLILVDELDSPLFWPLSVHELAHCWLSSQDSVVEISSELITSLEPEIQEGRVEEALCDAVATAIMGPSFVFSYINRLWTGFIRSNSPEYPKNSFRLKLMTRILKKNGYSDELQEIESMISDLGCDDWDDEEIANSLSSVEEFALELDFISAPPNFETEISSVSEFKKNPPENLQKLFHVGWNLLNQSDIETYDEWARSINSTIQKTLERNRSSFNT